MNKAEMPADPRYVWVAYTSRPPYLPVAVADTAAGLAREVGVSPGRSTPARLRRSRASNGDRILDAIPARPDPEDPVSQGEDSSGGGVLK